MKMKTTISVMTPLQYNAFHEGRGVFALAVPSDGGRCPVGEGGGWRGVYRAVSS